LLRRLITATGREAAARSAIEGFAPSPHPALRAPFSRKRAKGLAQGGRRVIKV